MRLLVMLAGWRVGSVMCLSFGIWICAEGLGKTVSWSFGKGGCAMNMYDLGLRIFEKSPFEGPQRYIKKIYNPWCCYRIVTSSVADARLLKKIRVTR